MDETRSPEICIKIRSARVVLPRNKIWYFFLHKTNLQSLNSNSANIWLPSWDWLRSNTLLNGAKSENDCLCLQINSYLAHTHGRGANLKAYMDGRSECCFIQKKRHSKKLFALMLRYEIAISFERILFPVFQIHTKSKYQFQEGQTVKLPQDDTWSENHFTR